MSSQITISSSKGLHKSVCFTSLLHLYHGYRDWHEDVRRLFRLVVKVDLGILEGKPFLVQRCFPPNPDINGRIGTVARQVHQENIIRRKRSTVRLCYFFEDNPAGRI